MSEASDKADLHRQLVRLGDMMGDGLHHEPDGKDQQGVSPRSQGIRLRHASGKATAGPGARTTN